jgi:peptide-methionine (R)-S-oxide reductase
MTRDDFLRSLIGIAATPLAGCAAPTDPALPDPDDVVYDLDTANRLRTEDEWRALLSPEAFQVLFEESTEPPGSSPLDQEFRAGTYICAACFTPLFGSSTKYDSKTGWPTFWEPLANRLGFKPDYALGVERTEYHCHRCGGHQGHVFDDGPEPTGKRYCNNGLALRFVPSGQELPGWR